MLFTAILLLSASCKRELEYQWTCGEDLVDERDGQTYQTRLINGDCWMIENLRIGKCVEPNTIIEDEDSIEHFCAKSCSELKGVCDNGGLYTFDEMINYGKSGEQGICPVGWHIPTVNEFEDLTGLLSGDLDDTIIDFLEEEEMRDFLKKFPCEKEGIIHENDFIDWAEKLKVAIVEKKQVIGRKRNTKMIESML